MIVPTHLEIDGSEYRFYCLEAKGEDGLDKAFLVLFRFEYMIANWGEWRLFLTKVVDWKLVDKPIDLVRKLVRASETQSRWP